MASHLFLLSSEKSQGSLWSNSHAWSHMHASDVKAIFGFNEIFTNLFAGGALLNN